MLQQREIIRDRSLIVDCTRSGAGSAIPDALYRIDFRTNLAALTIALEEIGRPGIHNGSPAPVRSSAPSGYMYKASQQESMMSTCDNSDAAKRRSVKVMLQSSSEGIQNDDNGKP